MAPAPAVESAPKEREPIRARKERKEKEAVAEERGKAAVQKTEVGHRRRRDQPVERKQGGSGQEGRVRFHKLCML